MQCHIRVKEHLDVCWQEWFEGLQITHEEAGTTLFSGSLRDQAALYGVLLKIRQLALARQRRLKWARNQAMTAPPARQIFVPPWHEEVFSEYFGKEGTTNETWHL